MKETKGLFQDYPLEERRQLLMDNAYKVQDDESFMKPLNSEEIEGYQSDMVELTMSIHKDRDELKEISKGFKDRIKLNEKLRYQAAQAVRYGAIEVTGETFLMDNQAEGVMEIYSVDGMLLSTRPLKRDERQLSILSSRTGTHL